MVRDCPPLGGRGVISQELTFRSAAAQLRTSSILAEGAVIVALGSLCGRTAANGHFIVDTSVKPWCSTLITPQFDAILHAFHLIIDMLCANLVANKGDYANTLVSIVFVSHIMALTICRLNGTAPGKRDSSEYRKATGSVGSLVARRT